MASYLVSLVYEVQAKDPHDAIQVLAKQTTDLIAMKSDELREHMGHGRICKEVDCKVQAILTRNTDGSAATVTEELV